MDDRVVTNVFGVQLQNPETAVSIFYGIGWGFDFASTAVDDFGVAILGITLLGGETAGATMAGPFGMLPASIVSILAAEAVTQPIQGVSTLLSAGGTAASFAGDFFAGKTTDTPIGTLPFGDSTINSITTTALGVVDREMVTNAFISTYQFYVNDLHAFPNAEPWPSTWFRTQGWIK